MTIARKNHGRPMIHLAILGIIGFITLPAAARQPDAFGRLDLLDQVGTIVEPATGTDRAVYEPLDRPVILTRFVGMWANRPGRCVGQNYADRMELRADLAIIAGHTFTLREALVEGNSQSEAAGRMTTRSEGSSHADDMLVRLVRLEGEPVRTIHFSFSDKSGRLILEEVGQPRRAYVRCSI